MVCARTLPGNETEVWFKQPPAAIIFLNANCLDRFPSPVFAINCASQSARSVYRQLELGWRLKDGPLARKALATEDKRISRAMPNLFSVKGELVSLADTPLVVIRIADGLECEAWHGRLEWVSDIGNAKGSVPELKLCCVMQLGALEPDTPRISPKCGSRF